MPKDYHIDDFIIKELESGGLTGKRLKERFNQRRDLEKPDDLKRSFGDAFHKLLMNGKIEIIGYFNVKRYKYDPMLEAGKITYSEYRQRIRNRTLEWDDLAYDLIKTEPVDISNLIKLYKSDPTKSKESYVELRKLFEKQISYISEHNFKKWNKLTNQIKKRKPNDSEILFIEAQQRVIEEIKRNPEIDPNTIEFNKMIKSKIESLEQEIAELRLKYNDSVIFILKYAREEIKPPILGYDPSRSEYDKYSQDEYEYHAIISDPMPESINSSHYCLDHNHLSEEDFLAKLNCRRPSSYDIVKAQDIFDYDLLYQFKRKRSK